VKLKARSEAMRQNIWNQGLEKLVVRWWISRPFFSIAHRATVDGSFQQLGSVVNLKNHFLIKFLFPGSFLC
jgi:hypothetical protein